MKPVKANQWHVLCSHTMMKLVVPSIVATSSGALEYVAKVVVLTGVCCSSGMQVVLTTKSSPSTPIARGLVKPHGAGI